MIQYWQQVVLHFLRNIIVNINLYSTSKWKTLLQAHWINLSGQLLIYYLRGCYTVKEDLCHSAIIKRTSRQFAIQPEKHIRPKLWLSPFISNFRSFNKSSIVIIIIIILWIVHGLYFKCCILIINIYDFWEVKIIMRKFYLKEK